MKTIAIIPARGGSKGIPRKNLMPIDGSPLIVRTIEQAKGASLVDRVIVSTDDKEIGEISKQHGAEVIWRPDDISGDTASSESALLNVLDQIENKEGVLPNVLVFLQCTSPFTLSEDIDNAVAKFINGHADSLLSASQYHYFLWQENDKGEAVGVNHDKSIRLRRQDQVPQFLENGAIYVMNCEKFRQIKHRFFGKTLLYKMPADRTFEIDEPEDLLVAELVLRARREAKKRNRLPRNIELVVFDFDGVFTDNKVIVLPDGNEAVICDRSDGMGISKLKNANIKTIVLSTETNDVLSFRCRKLGLEFYHNIEDKVKFLQDYLGSNHIDKQNVVYVGNDVNDLECMNYVGCAVAVADAFAPVLKIADIVLDSKGGKNAVRELCDMIIERKY